VLHLETSSNKDPIAVNASSDERDEIRYVADLSDRCIQGMQVNSMHCCVRGALQDGQVRCPGCYVTNMFPSPSLFRLSAP
jgi:hypothetical protein